MTKRAEIPLPNFENLQPFTKAQKVNEQDLGKIGQKNGFTTRHSVETKHASGSGRRRRSLKTARLTLALEPTVRDSFWSLADELNEDGGDFLNRLIENYVNNNYIQNK
ncbi:hypothetical protein [Bartonella doshiae]|uniref:Stability/partitioning determinant n=2 Tax=Bartonella doshiae TaxID=33044 RepID=A0A380ZER8_BARDO|nr:hypothetical protein [Bartonella doshiae]EJF79117.1 hypothetical protein MCS_01488 [Bartonella doshiae NCTC 12862 = ATCC 700133]MBB6160111.1 hypothetical protein [Bartonella doshiae]SUV45477.1 Uncharacterised protein [Bartonella doshiae]